MVRKSLNAFSGIKVNTVLGETKNKSKKKNYNAQKEEERIECLDCKKPVEKCKGNCFGRNK